MNKFWKRWFAPKRKQIDVGEAYVEVYKDKRLFMRRYGFVGCTMDAGVLGPIIVKADEAALGWIDACLERRAIEEPDGVIRTMSPKHEYRFVVRRTINGHFVEV